LEDADVGYTAVELGIAVINEDADETIFESDLKKAGFGLIKTKEEDVVEKTKIAIRKLFFENKKIELNSFDLKNYLEAETQLPYKRLSQIFSLKDNRTIEKYYILQRIEKVKSMIEETDLSFSDIAFELGYNSLSHLSKQFKTIVGFSMKTYRLKPKNRRRFIDEI
jgi:AraC-like DNA-binding protein